MVQGPNRVLGPKHDNINGIWGLGPSGLGFRGLKSPGLRV